MWVDRIVKTDPAAKNRSKVARKESRIDRRRVKVQVTEILGDKEFFCGVLICPCMFFYSSTLKEIKIEKPKEYEKLYLIYWKLTLLGDVKIQYGSNKKKTKELCVF